MKHSLFAVAVLFFSVGAFAQAQVARVYYCVAQQDTPKHLDTYWGDETVDLKSAQTSALQQCQADAMVARTASSDCQINMCWSSLADGQDQQSEATN